MRDTLRTIEELIRSTAWLKGHKSLIFVSEGFERSLALSTRSLLAVAQQEHIAIYFLDARGLKVLGRSADASVSGEGVVTGYVNGVPREIGPGPHEGDASLGAQDLAAATGGFTIQNTENLIGGLERVAQQNRTYYLLGFEPSSRRRDGKFHKIEVRVGPGEYEVHARQGYYAPGPDGRLRGEAQAALDPGAEIPLRLSAFVLEPVVGKRRVHLVAEADPAALRFEDQAEVALGAVESWVEVTPVGQPQGERTHHETKLRLTAEQRTQVAQTWVPLARDFELAPGRYRAVFRIKDQQSGRQGSVRHSFEVAGGQGLSFSTSTPILSDLVDANGNARPIARREFAPDSTLLCQVEAWPTGADTTRPRLTASYQLRGSDGSLLERSEPAPMDPDPDGRLTERLTLPLADLPEGEYLLAVAATDPASGETVTSEEPFVITALPRPK